MPTLNRTDIPGSRESVFSLTSRVVGRDPILTQLRALHRDTLAGTFKPLLVCGGSGMGKTALVDELRSDVAQGGLFIVAEHAPETQNSPLHGLLAAMDALVRQLEPDAADPHRQRAVQNWRQHLHDALGSCLPAFLHAFPSAAPLLGHAGTPTPLTLGAHADRLLTAVQRFFSAIAHRRPLTLVFEDLQWADGGTLRMFDALAHCDAQVPLFLIGTADPMGGEAQDLLTRLQRQLPNLLSLALDPLTPEGVQQLLSEALHTPPHEVEDLAAFLGQHTAGHPLFMRLLLQTLWQRGLLQYAPAAGHWDLHATSHPPFESLTSLIELRFEGLGPAARTVMETAAVHGHGFEADLIADALDLPTDEVEAALLHAQNANLVVCTPGTRHWRFRHAAIRAALLERHDSASLHAVQLKLGNQLLARHDRRPQPDSLLTALAPLLDAEAISPRMPTLCRAGAQQARMALDFGAALRLLTHLRFCEARAPAAAPRVATRDCLADIAELMAYHVAEEGDAALQTLVRDAHEPTDIDQAWRLRVQCAWHRGDVATTRSLGRAALRALGVTLPPLRDPWERWRLRNRLRQLTDPAALQRSMELSPCSASRARTTQQILATLVPACFGDPPLLMQVVVTGLQQVAAEGPERAAWPALLAGAIALHCQQDAPHNAEPLRLILEQTLDGNHDAPAGPWARFILLNCLESRKQVPDVLARSYALLGQEAAGAGDMYTSAWALLAAAQHLAVLSVPRAVEQLERAQNLFAWERLQTVHTAWSCLRDMLQALRGDGPQPSTVQEGASPEEAAPWILALWLKSNARAAWALGQRLLSQPTWPTLDHAVQGHLLFMAGLSAVHAEPSRRAASRRHLRRILKQLGPGTPLGMVLTAEDTRRSQAMLRTAYRYDEACRMLTDTRQQGLLAIAHECAARFFMTFDSARAALHLHQARDAYTQWGTPARLAKLEREFPEVLPQTTFGKPDAPLRTGKLSHHALDVSAIVNSISALSGEVVLTRLVQRVLQTVVENAGATRAIFVSCGAANLQVELDSAPHPAGVPHQLLWYVVRTRAPLLINSPAQDADFKRDPYIAARQPRCVLCAPVMHQGQTLALIYLENSLAADAFSADRVVLVQALATQAAISLENARMYQKLEAQVAARTHELAEAQAALMKTHQALRELDRAKSQFFANVSHEFRTPLTLILGPIEAALNTGNLPEPVRRQLGMCQRNSLRLLRLVDDMLALSRLESADLHLRLAPVNLGQALQDLVAQVQPWAARKSLTLDYAGEPNVILPADATELERVVLNLLNNAIKFTPAGGQITVRMRPEGAVVRVSVSDTGKGVPADALEKIFDRFYQVETDVNKQAGGTGIGLALCRRIVELHGGDIHATSTLGQGTTVSFTLPNDAPPGLVTEPGAPAGAEGTDWYDSLRQREAYKLAAFETGEPAAPAPVSPVATPVAETALILLVDDQPEMLAYLTTVLQDTYQICTAQEGLAGLHTARNMQPDLIISDVTMPGMSGYELLAALRADREMWHIPLVMLTARDAMEDKLAGIHRGADAYLTKPFAAAELHAVVAGLLAKQRSHREAGRALRNTELQLLVAGISHEILNPLGFIRSALYLINEEFNTPPQDDPQAMQERQERVNEAMIAAREGVERVRTAVTQLRQFNTNGALSPMQLTAPNRVVENVHRLTWHQIRFKAELSATRMVMARSGEIEQVLINLLNNAHHAAGAEGEVRVSTWDNHQGRVFLSVSDSGAGIPQDRLDAIFKPFVSSKVDGSGLGLYISRQIVREHGGELRVTSAPGSGATFTIELPSVDPQEQ